MERRKNRFPISNQTMLLLSREARTLSEIAGRKQRTMIIQEVDGTKTVETIQKMPEPKCWLSKR